MGGEPEAVAAMPWPEGEEMNGMDMRKRNDVIEDVKTHPERHQHTFAGLLKCCMFDGVLDTGVIDAHEKFAPPHEAAPAPTMLARDVWPEG